MPPTVSPPLLCAVCGESLGTGDVCVACLLRAGLDETDSAAVAARFGDFEIERRDDGTLAELGRGAMGVTYCARDHVLHRAVALKVIELTGANSDSDLVRARFLREARAAAALRHPNIAGVFQFGVSAENDRCYCAMELVEGETLEARVRRDGPIDVAPAIEIGVQVTKALIAAAERGLVHRDLKPGNIMLGRGDQVKVIDFGLAKAVTAGTGEMELTHGSFVGTPAFASPEQFGGGTVDSRSDVYALGVTLWFALTGRLPFSGTTIDEVRDRQQHNPPPAEQLRARRVPQRLIRLVTACLALDPAERPSPGELLRRLETCRARPNYRRYIVYAAAVVIATAGALPLWRSINEAPRSAVPSRDKGLAVLPFENLSANAEDAFLAEGIQDDVLTSVGKIKGLKVIARSSVQAYRGRLGPGKVRELGDALGISHVLEGSVRRTGERVVLNVALIDMQEERQIWAERYDRSLGEMASLHGELAREIGRALQTTLTPFENVAASAKPTANAEAYLLYLKGRELEVHRGDLNKALELYQQAIALDPTFALARARLSKALTTVNYQHNRADVQARARNEAEEALRLQPALGEARVALAHWYLYQNQDLNRAAEELRRAAELLPNWAEVQLTAAFLYKRQNRFRERIAALHRAEALDPRNPGVLGTLIMTSRWVRDWREAMQAADRRAVFTKGPAYLVTPWSRANDEFRLTGDINVLKRAVSQEEQAETPMSPERLNYARFEIATLERDFERAAHFLDQIPAEAFTEKSEPPSSLIVLAGHGKEFHQALLAIASHADSAAAKELFAHARQVTKAAIEALPSVTHGAKLHADVALLHAFAGEKDAAIQNAERAIELQSELSMGIERNDMFAVLALVYAQTGEADKALDLIEQLLTVPIELQDGAVYNMTVVDLKWRWVWDPLRGHPRFQKLIAGPEPQTVY